MQSCFRENSLSFGREEGGLNLTNPVSKGTFLEYRNRMEGMTCLMKKILVCGLNPAWQKTLHFRSLLPGEVNRAYALEQTASGKGINFSRAAKHWGKAETRLLQFAGGSTGKMLTDVLDHEGIIHITVNSSAVTRTCSTVISETPPSVTELIEPNEPVTFETSRELYQTGLDALDEVDALAVCGTYPPGVTGHFYSGLIEKAVRTGKFVMLDSFMNVEESLKHEISFMKVNQEEILKLTGQRELRDAFRFCKKHFRLKMTAVTAGASCAFFFDGVNVWRLSVPKVSKVVNPIGAGDTCSAVTCSEILSGTAPLEAFQLGLCAASASCLTPSAAEYDVEAARAFRVEILSPELIETL